MASGTAWPRDCRATANANNAKAKPAAVPSASKTARGTGWREANCSMRPKIMQFVTTNCRNSATLAYTLNANASAIIVTLAVSVAMTSTKHGSRAAVGTNARSADTAAAAPTSTMALAVASAAAFSTLVVTANSGQRPKPWAHAALRSHAAALASLSVDTTAPRFDGVRGRWRVPAAPPLR